MTDAELMALVLRKKTLRDEEFRLLQVADRLKVKDPERSKAAYEAHLQKKKERRMVADRIKRERKRRSKAA